MKLTHGEALRFIRQIRVTPAGCWEWTGRKTTGNKNTRDKGGYPKFFFRGKYRLAHRVMFAAVHGRPVKGQIDHLCRNRACVRPRCLDDVPALVNIHRAGGWAAANARKTHCIHGHEFTPENTVPQVGGRDCRTCRRDRDRRSKLKRTFGATGSSN